jgi:hypothetical protein
MSANDPLQIFPADNLARHMMAVELSPEVAKLWSNLVLIEATGTRWGSGLVMPVTARRYRFASPLEQCAAAFR